MNALRFLDAGDVPIGFALTEAGELAPPATPPAPFGDAIDGDAWDRLIALELLCVCSADQGAHDVDAPHGCAETCCAGFVEATAPESGVSR
jgi:hypothetical protein